MRLCVGGYQPLIDDPDDGGAELFGGPRDVDVAGDGARLDAFFDPIGDVAPPTFAWNRIDI